MTNATSDTARAADVNDLANVAEEASVDPASENVRLIRLDIDNDPDDQHLSTSNPLLDEDSVRGISKKPISVRPS